MRMLLLFLCLLPESVVSLVFTRALPPPVVTLPQGQLQGIWFTTRGGRRVPSFLGIPYAPPPVGELRFKSNQPPVTWQGQYQAVKDGPECPQYSLLAGYPLVRDVTGSEDCLYLNVFTPSVSPKEPLAVVVFFHGGALEIGSGNSLFYGPQYLLDEDVVLVTLNYRLGILGFLSLEHPVLAGNLGLKDQRAALRWVRDNIGLFGGDPDKVTIFGESAGAASVHYHMIFTEKEGLFRAAVCNSGSARALWAFQRPGGQRDLVAALVNLTACPSEPVSLVTCLRKIPALQFVNILHNIKEGDVQVHRKAAFRPMIEPDCVEDPLVTDNPWHTTTSLPLLAGTNQLEGLWGLIDFEKDKSDREFKKIDKEYASIWPYTLYLEDSSRDPSLVAQRLRSFYLQGDPIDREHFLPFVNLVSDAIHTYDVVESVRANTDKTYFYQFNYHGSNSVVRLIGSTSNFGVSHVDELFYLFPMGGLLLRNVTVADTRVSKFMVKMWTNFIKYLNPTPDGFPVTWKPVKTPDLEFLNINQRDVYMDSNFLKHRMDFWKSLPTQNKPQKDPPRCRRKSYSVRRIESDEPNDTPSPSTWRGR